MTRNSSTANITSANGKLSLNGSAERNELLDAVQQAIQEHDWDSPDSPYAQRLKSLGDEARKRLLG